MNLCKGASFKSAQRRWRVLETWTNQQPANTTRTGGFQLLGPMNSENGISREQGGVLRKEFYYKII